MMTSLPARAPDRPSVRPVRSIQTAVNWASRTRRDWAAYLAERASTPVLGNT